MTQKIRITEVRNDTEAGVWDLDELYWIWNSNRYFSNPLLKMNLDKRCDLLAPSFEKYIKN